MLCSCVALLTSLSFFFFFQAEDGIRDPLVTGVQTCALPIFAAELFERIAEKNISVDMIVQNVTTTADPHASITFTLAKTDLARAKPWIEEVGRSLGAREVRYDEDVVKVSIVGLGMRSHAGIAAKMFRILADERINIQAIATSEIKISCLMAAKYTELAVRALHDGFGLGV